MAPENMTKEIWVKHSRKDIVFHLESRFSSSLGTMTEEEVHGGVEVRVSPDHQQHQQVPCEGQEVNHQECYKEYCLDLRVVG